MAMLATPWFLTTYYTIVSYYLPLLLPGEQLSLEAERRHAAQAQARDVGANLSTTC